MCVCVCSGKGEVQKRLLEIELEAVGIRLNKRPPNIYFKVVTSISVEFIIFSFELFFGKNPDVCVCFFPEMHVAVLPSVSTVESLSGSQ